MERIFTPHHLSHVTCHITRDTCQVSHVTFFLLLFFLLLILDKVLELVGGGPTPSSLIVFYSSCWYVRVTDVIASFGQVLMVCDSFFFFWYLIFNDFDSLCWYVTVSDTLYGPVAVSDGQ